MALTVSHRCQSISPSPTLAIDARAKEMKARGVDVIGFGAGEPDFPTPQYIIDAAKEALDLGKTRYTPASGTYELRKAICDKLERDNDLFYKPQDIVVSSGAKHSLYNIFQAIIDPGDEVLIPTPCWVSYPEMVRMAGGVPVFIPTDESTDFIPTKKDIASRVNRRTKAMIITSPSNPNGSVWDQDQLQFVADLAVSHPFYVISDEIYEKLIFDGKTSITIRRCLTPSISITKSDNPISFPKLIMPERISCLLPVFVTLVRILRLSCQKDALYPSSGSMINSYLCCS